jgi:hypothetical protein
MALLLTNCAGGFRSSKMAAFDVRNLAFSAKGVVLLVDRSKADQERHGAGIGVEAVPGSAVCAVTALRRWLEVSGEAPGALFCRHDRAAASWEVPRARPAADRPGDGRAAGEARDCPHRH